MAVELTEEMTTLRRALLTLGAEVEQRVSQSVRALAERDIELARLVRMGDAEVDRMEVDIEAECLRVLALLHPLAGDLRFVLAAMRINTDLERTADVAKGVAKRIIAMQKHPQVPLPEPLLEMAGAAEEMFSKAVAAMAREDVDLSRQVRRSDQRVDDLQKEVFVWAQEEIPRHVDWTRTAIDILSIARKLERIGDLATNIAEDVIFLVEGSVIRHTKV
ncbi:MAG: phosphate signaling complex protein PhoU [Planctomycetota bacterium]|jgi:phosphate transport system protein